MRQRPHSGDDALAARQVRPGGSAGEDTDCAIQPISSEHETQGHLPGFRTVLVQGPQGGAARHAWNRSHEAARGVSPHQGMDQMQPAFAGQGAYSGAEPSLGGALQLLPPAGQLAVVMAVLPVGHGLCIQVAESKSWQAYELYLAGIHPRLRKARDLQAPDYRTVQCTAGVCMKLIASAIASTTEEPDAGILHVRDCAGGSG
jgi:hypothetical protein